MHLQCWQTTDLLNYFPLLAGSCTGAASGVQGKLLLALIIFFNLYHFISFLLFLLRVLNTAKSPGSWDYTQEPPVTHGSAMIDRHIYLKLHCAHHCRILPSHACHECIIDIDGANSTNRYRHQARCLMKYIHILHARLLTKAVPGSPRSEAAAAATAVEGSGS
jgi:hypothetical protein